MSVNDPLELDRRFEERLNAGDIDALVALYEPTASLMPMPGNVVSGTTAIRAALAGFIAAKPKISTDARLVSQAGDIAMLANHWTLELTGPDGKRTTMRGDAIEIARRQPDGSWLLAIDFPYGVDPH
jgi:uncharacterized protein (TIGR02246 family)